MVKRPKWLPDWVWDQYLDCIATFDAPEDAEYRDVVTRIATSLGCRGVWGSLDRRRGVAQKRRKELLLRQFPGRKIRPAMFEVGPELNDIASVAQGALHEFKGYVRMSKSERGLVGRRIVSLTQKLRGELNSLAGGNHWGILPNEITDEIGRWTGSYIEDYFAKTKERSRDHRDGFVIGISAAVWNFMEVLDSIERGATNFGSSQPQIHKPNKSTAERQFFIQQLTRHFNNTYGTPLRDCTLAITSVFYDCGDLDKSAIAQLAPSRSRTPT